MYMRPIYNYRDYQGDRCYHQKTRPVLHSLARLSLAAIAFLLGLGQSNAADHAAVLMYHRFGENQFPSTSIRLSQLDAHIQELKSGDNKLFGGLLQFD
mgnify:CR=1 FL=1